MRSVFFRIQISGMLLNSRNAMSGAIFSIAVVSNSLHSRQSDAVHATTDDSRTSGPVEHRTHNSQARTNVDDSRESQALASIQDDSSDDDRHNDDRHTSDVRTVAALVVSRMLMPRLGSQNRARVGIAPSVQNESTLPDSGGDHDDDTENDEFMENEEFGNGPEFAENRAECTEYESEFVDNNECYLCLQKFMKESSDSSDKLNGIETVATAQPEDSGTATQTQREDSTLPENSSDSENSKALSSLCRAATTRTGVFPASAPAIVTTSCCKLRRIHLSCFENYCSRVLQAAEKQARRAARRRIAAAAANTASTAGLPRRSRAARAGAAAAAASEVDSTTSSNNANSSSNASSSNSTANSNVGIASSSAGVPDANESSSAGGPDANDNRTNNNSIRSTQQYIADAMNNVNLADIVKCPHCKQKIQIQFTFPHVFRQKQCVRTEQEQCVSLMKQKQPGQVPGRDKTDLKEGTVTKEVSDTEQTSEELRIVEEQRFFKLLEERIRKKREKAREQADALTQGSNLNQGRGTRNNRGRGDSSSRTREGRFSRRSLRRIMIGRLDGRTALEYFREEYSLATTYVFLAILVIGGVIGMAFAIISQQQCIGKQKMSFMVVPTFPVLGSNQASGPRIIRTIMTLSVAFSQWISGIYAMRLKTPVIITVEPDLTPGNHGNAVSGSNSSEISTNQIEDLSQVDLASHADFHDDVSTTRSSSIVTTRDQSSLLSESVPQPTTMEEPPGSRASGSGCLAAPVSRIGIAPSIAPSSSESPAILRESPAILRESPVSLRESPGTRVSKDSDSHKFASSTDTFASSTDNCDPSTDNYDPSRNANSHSRTVTQEAGRSSRSTRFADGNECYLCLQPFCEQPFCEQPFCEQPFCEELTRQTFCEDLNSSRQPFSKEETERSTTTRQHDSERNLRRSQHDSGDLRRSQHHHDNFENSFEGSSVLEPEMPTIITTSCCKFRRLHFPCFEEYCHRQLELAERKAVESARREVRRSGGLLLFSDCYEKVFLKDIVKCPHCKGKVRLCFWENKESESEDSDSKDSDEFDNSGDSEDYSDNSDNDSDNDSDSNRKSSDSDCNSDNSDNDSDSNPKSSNPKSSDSDCDSGNDSDNDSDSNRKSSNPKSSDSDCDCENQKRKTENDNTESKTERKTESDVFSASSALRKEPERPKNSNTKELSKDHVNGNSILSNEDNSIVPINENRRRTSATSTENIGVQNISGEFSTVKDANPSAKKEVSRAKKEVIKEVHIKEEVIMKGISSEKASLSEKEEQSKLAKHVAKKKNQKRQAGHQKRQLKEKKETNKRLHYSREKKEQRLREKKEEEEEQLRNKFFCLLQKRLAQKREAKRSQLRSQEMRDRNMRVDERIQAAIDAIDEMENGNRSVRNWGTDGTRRPWFMEIFYAAIYGGICHKTYLVFACCFAVLIVFGLICLLFAITRGEFPW